MVHSHQSAAHLSLNPVALGCYSVATCSAVGAVLGLFTHHFPLIGFSAITGLYVVIGVISQLLTKTQPRLAASHSMIRDTSGVENLVAEAVTASHDVDATKGRVRALAAATR